MAEDIAREIISQSRTMQAHKSPLAFKFDNGAGKSLILSTFDEVGGKVYLITVEDGQEKCALKYKDWCAVTNLIKAFLHGDGSSSPSIEGNKFKLISLNNGAAGVVIAQFEIMDSPFIIFKEFLARKMALLNATRG